MIVKTGAPRVQRNHEEVARVFIQVIQVQVIRVQAIQVNPTQVTQRIVKLREKLAEEHRRFLV
jgi:hypothetical protein